MQVVDEENDRATANCWTTGYWSRRCILRLLPKAIVELLFHCPRLRVRKTDRTRLAIDHQFKIRAIESLDKLPLLIDDCDCRLRELVLTRTTSSAGIVMACRAITCKKQDYW